MFAKLLKMEFRSTWNVLGILCLSLVGAGLLGGVAIRYLVGASAPKEWLEVLCTLAITAAVLFFVVCGVAALIVQIVRFYRSRFSKDTQGVGLGLPLAKAIIEAHNGTIEVDTDLHPARHHPSGAAVQLRHQCRQPDCRGRRQCHWPDSDGAVRRAGF